MDCENIFCLYNRRGKCLLGEIQVDIRGGCISCLYVNIDEDYLEEQKELQLKKLEGDYND